MPVDPSRRDGFALRCLTARHRRRVSQNTYRTRTSKDFNARKK